MVQPINYMAQIPQVDLGESLLHGLRLGSSYKEIQDKRIAQERAHQLQQQYAADLQSTLMKPTAEGFAALSAKYPGQREAFKQSWDMLSQSQKDSDFSAGVQAYSAITSGNPDVAKTMLDERIAAYENAGKDASKLKSMRSTLDSDPKQVAAQLGLSLSSVDPERWGRMATEMRSAQRAPSELTEAQAKAQKAATEAKFAESNAAIELEKKGWDIKKIQEDIKIAKENARIAAMTAAIAREGNALKKQELQLKLQEVIEKRDNTIREKASDIESARFNIDNMLNTADRILKNPKLDSVLGSVQGRVGSYLSDEGADAIALIDTLGSQAFLAQIPNIKGTGQLSNEEGKKLQSALQNLTREQSEAQFRTNLKEAQRLMLKARKNISTRYGVPDTVPDTPAASPSGGDIDALLRKYGAQ